MKVLHVLDRSVPNVSGYASRSQYIMEFQRLMGMEPLAVTSPGQPPSATDVDRIRRSRLLPDAGGQRLHSQGPRARALHRGAADDAAPRAADRRRRAGARRGRHPRALADPGRHPGRPGGAAPRRPVRLRGARAVGGRRGRPGQDPGGRTEVPDYPAPRDRRAAPVRHHHRDLRGAEERDREPGHRRQPRPHRAEWCRHRQVRARRARPRAGGPPWRRWHRGHRVHRAVLHVRRPRRPAAGHAGDAAGTIRLQAADRRAAAGSRRAPPARRIAGPRRARGVRRPGAARGSHAGRTRSWTCSSIQDCGGASPRW